MEQLDEGPRTIFAANTEPFEMSKNDEDGEIVQKGTIVSF
jgi:hypothetical protein